MGGSSFYAPSRQTRQFGFYGGSTYTIVPGLHIGMDVRGGTVPAMVGGRVVRRVFSGSIGRGVVLDTGMPGARRYHSYWHLADDRLPRTGEWVGAGERVGRTARGPKTLPESNPDWPGRSWLGEHCHVVVGGHPDSGHMLVAGHRTLSAFTDPRVILAEADARPASGGGVTPFPVKPKEWDEMATQAEIEDAFRKVLDERMAGAVSIVPTPDQGIFLFSPITGRRVHIANTYHLGLIQRAVTNNSDDTMLPVEMDIVGGYITAVNPPAGASVDVDALAEKLGRIEVTADASVVKAAVESALRETVSRIRLTA